MGRKNGNTQRSTRKPQANRDRFGNAGKSRPAPIPLDKMIMPTGTCPTKKHRFTAENADEALRQAQVRRANLRSGRVEKRHYFCDRCGGHHLTSREEWTPRS